MDWSPEERKALQEDIDLAWLANEFPGCVHCRPVEPHGIKLGWAFETNESLPEFDFGNHLSPNFPEVVIRGASRLQPALKTYLDNLPRNQLSLYGGWYSMTDENWPLIGPTTSDNKNDMACISIAPLLDLEPWPLVLRVSFVQRGWPVHRSPTIRTPCRFSGIKMTTHL